MSVLPQGRLPRLATVLALMTTIALSAPAFAIDSGGGDDAPAPAAAPAMQAAPAMKPAPAKAHFVSIDAGRRLIAKKDWTGAIKTLRQVVAEQPKNPDALNLLGYSLRQDGQMQEAEAFYLKALKLDPKHLGANEYLGELYVMTGQLDKARVRLAEIRKVCGNTTCDAYQDLSKAIAAKA